MANIKAMYLVTIFLDGGHKMNAVRIGPFTEQQEAETECTVIMTHLWQGAHSPKPYRYEVGSKVSWILPEQFRGVSYTKMEASDCNG